MKITNLRKIEENAHSKINLYLEVLGKRKDGYREIETIFAELELHDTLTFILTKKKQIKVLSNIPELSGENNLVYKVAQYLKDAYAVEHGIDIFIEKRIPVAAGLGGGSSDAACAIDVLSKLWKLNLDKNKMNEIASSFGSDINFFLKGGVALGTGRGEKIVALSDVNLKHVLLINPNFEIKSSEAYSLVSEHGKTADWKNHVSMINSGVTFNRLEIGIKEKYELIREILDAGDLKKEHLRLSGSGPTIYGLFDSKDAAAEIKDIFDKKGYWTCLTKIKKR